MAASADISCSGSGCSGNCSYTCGGGPEKLQATCKANTAECANAHRLVNNHLIVLIIAAYTHSGRLQFYKINKKLNRRT